MNLYTLSTNRSIFAIPNFLYNSVSEISQAGAGIDKSFKGAGDLAEDKSHWVINTYVCHLAGEL